MKPKGLLIAVVLLAVLGGLIWWSNKRQASASKAPATTETKILTIPEDQIQEIKIQHANGDVVDMRRDSGKWRIVQPKELAADPDASSSLVSALTSVTADKTIEDKAADVSPYGLNHPTLDATITKKDGKTSELLIGDDTPNNSGSYAKLPNDPRVFTVFSFVKTSLDKSLNDLRDKRLLAFDSDKLTRVELAAKGQPVEFSKNGQNEWQILKPRPLRADNAQVDTLIGKLKDAKMDATVSADDAKKAAAAFASGTKVATATVTDSSGTQTLEVRKDKDKNYYAKSSAVEGIFKISSDVGDALDKGVDDFRNKKIFDFGFSDPSKLDIKSGASAPVTYTKTGDKWMSGSKAMDNSTVQNLIDKLRDLSAAKFPDKGAGEPAFDATVTSNSGKRVEKVTITKQGSQYFAKREGEPSIYELDGKAVEDLQKAASDVKEQQAAPPKKK
jgi:ribosomal protein L12E/L44/L45/RPP1/RPP2